MNTSNPNTLKSLHKKLSQYTEEYIYLFQLNSPLKRESATDIDIIQSITPSQKNKEFKKFKSFANSNSAKTGPQKENVTRDGINSQRGLSIIPELKRICQINYIRQKKRFNETTEWKHFLQLNEQGGDHKMGSLTNREHKKQKSCNTWIKRYNSDALIMNMKQHDWNNKVMEPKRRKLKFTLKQNLHKKTKAKSAQIPSYIKIKQNENLKTSPSQKSLHLQDSEKQMRQIGKIKSNKTIKSSKQLQGPCSQCMHLKQNMNIIMNKLKGVVSQVKKMSYKLQEELTQFKQNYISNYLKNIQKLANYNPEYSSQVQKKVLQENGSKHDKVMVYGVIDEVIQDISKDILKYLENEFVLDNKVKVKNSHVGKIVKNTSTGDSTKGESCHRTEQNSSEIKIVSQNEKEEDEEKQNNNTIQQMSLQKLSLREHTHEDKKEKQEQQSSSQEWSQQMIIQDQLTKHSSQISPYSLTNHLRSSLQQYNNPLQQSLPTKTKQVSKSVENFKRYLNNLKSLRHEDQEDDEIQNEYIIQYDRHPSL